MSDTPTPDQAVGRVEAAVVVVTYGGHDCDAQIESLWGTYEEAEARAAELLLEDDEGQQVFALDFPPARLL